MEDFKESVFKVRTYGWTELAMCYNPEVTPGSAARLLKQWVNGNEPLRTSLRESGYVSGQHKLTPLQVRTIISYLGAP